MAEHTATRLLLMRLAFLGLGLVLVLFQLLPLQHVARQWAGPDLLIALALAWAFRRPDYVPALSIAALFLLADLLFQRPPGLLAALMVLGAENVKTRARNLHEQTFLVEWFSFAVLVVSITLIYRIVLTVLLTSQAPLGLSLIQAIMTIAIYPLVVLLSHLLLGMQKPNPGEINALGHR